MPPLPPATPNPRPPDPHLFSLTWQHARARASDLASGNRETCPGRPTSPCCRARWMPRRLLATWPPPIRGVGRRDRWIARDWRACGFRGRIAEALAQPWSPHCAVVVALALAPPCQAREPEFLSTPRFPIRAWGRVGIAVVPWTWRSCGRARRSCIHRCARSSNRTRLLGPQRSRVPLILSDGPCADAGLRAGAVARALRFHARATVPRVAIVGVPRLTGITNPPLA